MLRGRRAVLGLSLCDPGERGVEALLLFIAEQVNDGLLLGFVLVLTAFQREVFIILKRLVDGLLLIRIRTYSSVLYLELPLLGTTGIFPLFACAELISLPLALHPVCLIAVLTVEAVRRVVSIAISYADAVILIVEINEALLRFILNRTD